MANNRVLIADDELSVRRLLYEVARKAGYQPCLAENGLEAIEKARELRPQVVILDLKMPVIDGMEAFSCIHSEQPDAAIILLTAHGSAETTVAAMKLGAFDFLTKPANVAEVRSVLAQAFQTRHLSQAASGNRPADLKTGPTLIGQTAAIRAVYKVVGKVAPTSATVLLTGESGSGKEVFAKTIHENSLRASGPFIKVNCGALPEGLMESEFFGYEKGAFTGAASRKPGRFELAQSGTLLLDEVGELTPFLQVKLLRVLQEKEFERVGGTQTIKADVRIIATTNRDLEVMVRQGEFREDLFYRLNVVPIHVPPLRERKEDIVLLVDYFVRHFAAEANREPPIITPDAMEYLCNHSWPGNVRELANTLERAVIMSQGVIKLLDLSRAGSEAAPQYMTVALTGSLRDILHRAEKEVISRMLRANEGNRLKTAQILGISRRALFYKIDEYDLVASKQFEEQSLEQDG
jgi:two-component system response regulator AtoC